MNTWEKGEAVSETTSGQHPGSPTIPDGTAHPRVGRGWNIGRGLAEWLHALAIEETIELVTILAR